MGDTRTYRPLRVPGSWLMPWLALSAANDSAAPDGYGAVPMLVGLAAGAGWQALHRRDLVDRLTFFASLVVVATGLGLVTGASWHLGASPDTELVAVGILTGLVFTEHTLRWRDHRRAQAAVRITEPARG